ncbi:hypothetical protein Pmani_015262 [Petrolisthes manimaculis]|uniref:Uncharacterized protein n=1 Tax=Petrolisthes manimaculis TaxID=1843537 RepID=A0AAE1PTV3_9EUCA|nr:hypothetical protein Pmani_015262 [Petrolisthes manimaculis]
MARNYPRPSLTLQHPLHSFFTPWTLPAHTHIPTVVTTHFSAWPALTVTHLNPNSPLPSTLLPLPSATHPPVLSVYLHL